MAIAFKFDEAAGCYFVSWTGTIPVDEYYSHFRTVIAKPWFRKELNVIHDLRNAGLESVRANVLTKSLAYDSVASEFGDGTGAVLVSGVADKRFLSLFVTASVKARGLVESFDNDDDARTWAGLPEDYPDPFEDAWAALPSRGPPGALPCIRARGNSAIESGADNAR